MSMDFIEHLIYMKLEGGQSHAGCFLAPFRDASMASPDFFAARVSLCACCAAAWRFNFGASVAMPSAAKTPDDGPLSP